MTELATSLTSATLPPSATPLPTYDARWAYLLPAANTGDMTVISPQGLQTASSTAAVVPIAYWNSGTFPADQWVEFEISSTTGGTYMGVVLWATGTQAMTCGLRPNVNQLSLSYTTAYSASATVSSSPVGGQPPALSPAVAVGNVFRVGMQGWQLTIWRGVSGNPARTQIYTWTVSTTAQGVLVPGGKPGLYASQAGALWGIRNWAAGDFQTGPLPPTPPTGPQGAFTVRTT